MLNCAHSNSLRRSSNRVGSALGDLFHNSSLKAPGAPTAAKSFTTNTKEKSSTKGILAGRWKLSWIALNLTDYSFLFFLTGFLTVSSHLAQSQRMASTIKENKMVRFMRQWWLVPLVARYSLVRGSMKYSLRVSNTKKLWWNHWRQAQRHPLYLSIPLLECRCRWMLSLIRWRITCRGVETRIHMTGLYRYRQKYWNIYIDTFIFTRHILIFIYS